MAANLQSRDQQVGLEQAWHRQTKIVDRVTRENTMPWDVIEAPIFYKVPSENPLQPDKLIEDPTFKTLLATDDWLPVGQPYGPSYCPTSIAMFWKVIEQGMGDTPYDIISAGTVENRQKVFASIKVSDGFKIGDREFRDYITLLDSFDKSTCLQARYTNVCVVCSNTFAAAMRAGSQIGKAKHTLMVEENAQRLVDAIDKFVGTSASFKAMLEEAFQKPCSRDEARAWLTGIEGRNVEELSNGMKQKTARLVELFETGRGNEGRTRLDAFSAVTEFHTHESSNRKGEDSQYMSSEWGASSQIKTLAASRLMVDWDANVKHGNRLLEEKKVVLSS